MRIVYVTIKDYEQFLEADSIGEPLYYDSPQQLYEYEGDVPFMEYYLITYNLN